MENSADNVRSQMRKGVLEYCILSILARKEAYASSILDDLKSANMIVVEGTLYPLLIRQKNQGLLSSEILLHHRERPSAAPGDGPGLAGDRGNHRDNKTMNMKRLLPNVLKDNETS